MQLDSKFKSRKFSITILQHSFERNHPHNSTRIAKLGLKNVTVVTSSDVNFEAQTRVLMGSPRFAARNNVYVNVVERQGEAFNTEEVVRLDCADTGAYEVIARRKLRQTKMIKQIHSLSLNKEQAFPNSTKQSS